jgi:hypothetical protein
LIQRKGKQKGSLGCLFREHLPALLDAGAILVGACVDFDLVADFNESRDR